MSSRNHLDYDCLPTVEKSCDNWSLKTGLQIGDQSSHGTVYIACKDLAKKDCIYALKLVKFYEEVKSVEHEVRMQNLCADREFCPRVIDWWIHYDEDIWKTFGVIITDLLKESVKSSLVRHIKEYSWSLNLIKDCLMFIYKFHQSGMYHGDAHLGNIMFDNENKLKFIDMDTAGLYSELLQARPSQKKIQEIQEAVYEDYSQFEENGIGHVFADAQKFDTLDQQSATLLVKLMFIIRGQIVSPIRNEKMGKNERLYEFLYRLRDIEYTNLNKLLAMDIDEIMKHEIFKDPPYSDPIPLTSEEIIAKPSRLKISTKLPEPLPTKPISVELLGPPRGSISELSLDLPPEEEPSVKWFGGSENILSDIDDLSSDEPRVKKFSGFRNIDDLSSDEPRVKKFSGFRNMDDLPPEEEPSVKWFGGSENILSDIDDL